jgi:hypothetical protein
MDLARVEVAGEQLTVQIEAMDKLWTFKSRLEIPLAHVTDAEADPGGDAPSLAAPVGA